jgi:hypothetical protein
MLRNKDRRREVLLSELHDSQTERREGDFQNTGNPGLQPTGTKTPWSRRSHRRGSPRNRIVIGERCSMQRL